MTTAQEDTLIAGLARFRPHLAQQGPVLLKAYPHSQIPQAVYDQITVPVPLPLALILYSLALSLLTVGGPEKDVTGPAQ